MIKPDSKIVDDLARFAGGAVGIASELKQSIEGDIKERVEQVANNLDLVSRDEFEKLEHLVKQQQAEIDALKKASGK